MGKPTGFLEYLRELPVDRTATERVKDWNEFHLHMEEKKLKQQGARCMDCGVPFCHTGKLISGMASGCPDQQPDSRVERPGLPRPLAARRSIACTRRTTFPSSPVASARRRAKARACSASTTPPVTIKNIECSIIDKGWEEGWVAARAADGAHRQESRRHRFRARGSLRRRAAQQGRPHRHRLRARRSSGRPAHVRHPEHEARQEGGRAPPHRVCWRRRASSSSATPTSAKTSSRRCS